MLFSSAKKKKKYIFNDQFLSIPTISAVRRKVYLKGFLFTASLVILHLMEVSVCC